MSWAIVAGRFFVGGLVLIGGQAAWLFAASQFFPHPMPELMLAFGLWLFVGSALMMAGAIIGLLRRFLGDGSNGG